MSFEYTETYRSGHNGADSKSVREQSPASSNLAVSAIKKQVHFCAPAFYIMRDSKRAMRSIETVRGTVSVAGCVPPNAEVRQANFAVPALSQYIEPKFIYNFAHTNSFFATEHISQRFLNIRDKNVKFIFLYLLNKKG